MKGFTLIELLIVIGIITILAAVSVPIYGSLQVKAQLDETTSQVIQALRSAREESIAGYNNVAHGVFFDINLGGNDYYIIYQGDSYDTRNTSYDKETMLESALSFVNSSFVLNGANVDVNFSKGLGKPNNTGSINLVHDVVGSRVINVNTVGKVEEN